MAATLLCRNASPTDRMRARNSSLPTGGHLDALSRLCGEVGGVDRYSWCGKSVAIAGGLHGRVDTVDSGSGRAHAQRAGPGFERPAAAFVAPVKGEVGHH